MPTTTESSSAMTEKRDGIKELIGEVLARRDVDTRYRSSVARGVEATTEHYAYPWVLRFVDDERGKTAMLRAAGLCAAYREVPQASRPLGASLRALSLSRSDGKSIDPGKPDVIASRLANLQEQDLEQAAATIRRFLDLARGRNIGFDFYRIGRLFDRWGNGYTEASQAVRMSVLGDYYGAWTYDAPTTTSNNRNQEN